MPAVLKDSQNAHFLLLVLHGCVDPLNTSEVLRGWRGGHGLQDAHVQPRCRAQELATGCGWRRGVGVATALSLCAGRWVLVQVVPVQSREEGLVPLEALLVEANDVGHGVGPLWI